MAAFVFHNPLKALSWTLSGLICELKKINKVATLCNLQNNTPLLLKQPNNYVAIFKRMAPIQKLKLNGSTFHEVTEGIFRSILLTCQQFRFKMYLIVERIPI